MNPEWPPVVQAAAATQQAELKPALVKAEEDLKAQLDMSPTESLGHLITATTAPGVPPPLQQLCAIRAKNFIRRDLDQNVHQVDFAFVKEALLGAIPAAGSLTRKSLLECARVVHVEEPWDDIVPVLTSQLAESAQGGAEGAARAIAMLQLAYVIARPFKILGAVSMDEQADFSAALLPVLPSVLVLEDLHVTHWALKVFEAMVQHETPPALKDRTLFGEWMSFLLGFANRPPPTDTKAPEYGTYLKCMKRVALVTHRFVQPPNAKKRPKVSIEFINAHGPAFLEAWLQWLRYVAPFDDSTQLQHIKVTAPALSFVRAAAAVEPLYTLLPLKELCTALLFPYFPFNEQDEELWVSDLNEYLRRLEEASAFGRYDARQIARKTLLTLVAARKPFMSRDVLPAVLSYIHEGLQQPASKATDGLLFVLASLKPVIRRVPEICASMEQALVQHIAPLLRHDHEILRAKAVWICGLYAFVPFESDEGFEAMLREMLRALDDKDIGVRTQVIASLANVLAVPRARGFLREALPPLTRECVRLVDDNNSDFAVQALEALLDVFGPEMSAYLSKVCASLIQRAKAAVHEATTMGDPEDYDGGEDDTANHMAMLASHSTFLAIEKAVEAFGYDLPSVPEVQQDVYELVSQCFDSGDIEVLERGLKILDRLIYFMRDQLPDVCWEVLPRLNALLEEDGGVELFAHYLPIIDNLATNLPAKFVEPPRLQLVHGMLSKMLNPELSVTESAVDAAPELLYALLLNLQPLQAPPMHEAFPSFVELILQALQHHERPSVRAELCTALMAGFYYSVEATLAVMEESGVTMAVLSAYASFITPETVSDLVRTALSRKVHVLGILSLLRDGPAPIVSSVAEPLAVLAASCVGFNEAVYTRQIEELQKLLQGTLDKEDGDKEEAYEDTDSVMEDVEAEDDEEEEERDIDDLQITTSIDGICEVEALVRYLSDPGTPSPVPAAVQQSWPNVADDLTRIAATSGEVIRRRQTVRDQAAQRHAMRAQTLS